MSDLCSDIRYTEEAFLFKVGFLTHTCILLIYLQVGYIVVYFDI